MLACLREFDGLEADLELVNVRDLAAEEVLELRVDSARLPHGCRRLLLLILLIIGPGIIIIIRAAVIVAPPFNNLALLQILLALLILERVNLIRVHLLITNSAIGGIF